MLATDVAMLAVDAIVALRARAAETLNEDPELVEYMYFTQDATTELDQVIPLVRAMALVCDRADAYMREYDADYNIVRAGYEPRHDWVPEARALVEALQLLRPTALRTASR